VFRFVQATPDQEIFSVHNLYRVEHCTIITYSTIVYIYIYVQQIIEVRIPGGLPEKEARCKEEDLETAVVCLDK
jgi:hypothetical protein